MSPVFPFISPYLEGYLLLHIFFIAFNLGNLEKEWIWNCILTWCLYIKFDNSVFAYYNLKKTFFASYYMPIAYNLKADQSNVDK